MQKLIDKFKSDTSAANAEKIRKHAKKSVMAVCMISADDMKFLRDNGINL